MFNECFDKLERQEPPKERDRHTEEKEKEKKGGMNEGKGEEGRREERKAGKKESREEVKEGRNVGRKEGKIFLKRVKRLLVFVNWLLCSVTLQDLARQFTILPWPSHPTNTEPRV